MLIALRGSAQETLFGPQQIIQEIEALNPSSVFAADLDGDRDQDIVFSSLRKIGWFENLGVGVFGHARVITTSASGGTVHAADLDGDGDLDVLSSSQTAWYENTDGLGQFGPLREITTPGTGASSIFAADFDGDGDQDVLSLPPNEIAWHENTDGRGAFGLQRTITTTVAGQRSVFAVDMDGDGDQDVLFASSSESKIAWFENADGRGAFGPELLITNDASAAYSVFAADLDGDGDQDVLSAGNRTIAWYENTDSAGVFGTEQVITTFVSFANSVFAADLDGDGDLDVLSASRSDDTVAWYENTDGRGAFGAQKVITRMADGARWVFAADLDGDGDQDVLSTSFVDDKIAWYKNTDGRGAFGRERAIASKAWLPQSVHAADLDGDGDLDVLSASHNDNKIAWYENIGGLRPFGGQRVISISAFGADSVFAADLDGDGDQDVLSAPRDSRDILWHENTDGMGSFDRERMIASHTRGSSSILAADLDGDGDLDVLSAARADMITWYPNIRGTGTFDFARPITTEADVPLSIAAADLDGDGDLDVLSASRDDHKIAWYENTDGNGEFGPQRVITNVAIGAGSVIATDLDGDGDQDVLSASGIGIAWHENTDGRAAFGALRLIATIADARPLSLFATDLDGDGDNDVLSAWSDHVIAWHENIDGKGFFGLRRVITNLAIGPKSVFAADLDGDGDQDVLSASVLDNKIAWYENLSAPIFIELAEIGNPGGWIDHALGDATLMAPAGTGPLAGLCIFSPVAGDNIGVWESPRAQAIPLSRNSVYRVRFTMSTDQTHGAAQPVWNLLIDNLNRSTGEVIWGSVRWFYANAGFANGIGNTGFDGLTQFDAWIVPNPVTTDAWNGLVYHRDSPFNEANLEAAAFNIKFRVIDIEPIAGATTEDTGTVCLRSVQVDRFDLTALDADGPPLWGSETTLPPDLNVLLGAASGSGFVESNAVVIDDEIGGIITIELDEPPATGILELDQGIGRALVQFEDLSRPAQSLLRLHPVPWNDGELLRLTAEIRSTAAAPNNPIDVIGLGWQTATNELGGFDFSFRGQPGGLMDRAASPRGDPIKNSTYTSFFYTHHSTDVDLNLLPDANRLRGVLDFFNRTDLAGALGEGNLSDPFEIRSMAIHRIVYNEDLFGLRPAE